LGKREHFIEHSSDKSPHTNLLHQFSVVGGFKHNAGRVKSDWTYHSLVLLLSYVGRDLAVNLSGAQCHGEGLGHV
jgi:hypothetical protein